MRELARPFGELGSIFLRRRACGMSAAIRPVCSMLIAAVAMISI